MIVEISVFMNIKKKNQIISDKASLLYRLILYIICFWFKDFEFIKAFNKCFIYWSN